MITTSLFFVLQATPSGELDTWNELLPGQYIPRPSDRVVRRTIDCGKQDGWPGYGFYPKPLYEFTKNLCAEFLIKYEGYSHGRVDLDSPRLAEFHRRMIELRETVGFKSGALTFKLSDDETTPCEWFILSPNSWPRDSISGGGTENICCRTDRMPWDTHAVGYNFVSEDFKRVVETYGFTGAEFIWLPDTSKKPARQWFRIVAKEPIGRGIDHDWFDPETLTGKDAQLSDPLHRCGVNYFPWKQIKKGAGFGDPIKDGLIALFPPYTSFLDGLSFGSFRRLLRPALPRTDFAFVWLPVRQVCFTRRVKEALIKEGVLSAGQCEPMLVLDSPPPGVLVLDGEHPCPPPAYEPVDEFERIRAKNSAAWKKFSANRPPPSPRPSIDHVLDQLRNIIHGGQHKFESPTTIKSVQKATESLSPQLPGMWCKVWSEANGGVIFGVFGDLRLRPAQFIAGFHEEETRSGLHCNPDFPLHLLHFASTGCGDFLSFDTSKLTANGDCQVILMSHETYEPYRKWPSIPEFLAEVFETANEE